MGLFKVVLTSLCLPASIGSQLDILAQKVTKVTETEEDGHPLKSVKTTSPTPRQDIHVVQTAQPSAQRRRSGRPLFRVSGFGNWGLGFRVFFRVGARFHILSC